METINSNLLLVIEHDISEAERLENSIQWFWYAFGLNTFPIAMFDEDEEDINNIYY